MINRMKMSQSHQGPPQADPPSAGTTSPVLGYVMLVTLCLGVLVTSFAYAFNLEKLKSFYLDGNYKEAIAEGEKILANAKGGSGLDELYYFLGLSYLKDGNYLRASDIFEIIIKEFKGSGFKDSATVGLADAYFLKGDYLKAQDYYKELLEKNAQAGIKPLLYCRLSQCAAKLGDIKLAKEYSDRLKQDFPFSLELGADADLCALPGLYYSVQVGSFSKKANAEKLTQQLVKKGYDAYIDEAALKQTKTFRVRVGKLSQREQAEDLENKLTGEGYPTKIYP